MKVSDIFEKPILVDGEEIYLLKKEYYLDMSKLLEIEGEELILKPTKESLKKRGASRLAYGIEFGFYNRGTHKWDMLDFVKIDNEYFRIEFGTRICKKCGKRLAVGDGVKHELFWFVESSMENEAREKIANLEGKPRCPYCNAKLDWNLIWCSKEKDEEV